MLILLFRGIFLIGILSWYSTNVWKMIDGYFKDRFEKYLQREYEKNPKMRDDVDAYGTSVRNDKGNVAPDVVRKTTKDTDRVNSMQQRSCVPEASHVEETCPIDLASMEVSAGDETGSGSLSSTRSSREDKIGSGGTSESKVIGKGAADANDGFAKSSSVSRDGKPPVKCEGNLDNDEVAKSVLTEKTIAGNVEEIVTSNTEASKGAATESAVVEEKNDEIGKKVARKPAKRKSTQRRYSRESLKSKISEENEEERNKGKKKKKQKVKTIILTDEDFKQAKIRSGLQDYDFSEFDDEGNEVSNEPPEGILVSQLPFKPRADIGNLERVNDDEFCPLTLEDEVNCGETKSWP